MLLTALMAIGLLVGGGLATSYTGALPEPAVLSQADPPQDPGDATDPAAQPGDPGTSPEEQETPAESPASPEAPQPEPQPEEPAPAAPEAPEPEQGPGADTRAEVTVSVSAPASLREGDSCDLTYNVANTGASALLVRLVDETTGTDVELGNVPAGEKRSKKATVTGEGTSIDGVAVSTGIGSDGSKVSARASYSITVKPPARNAEVPEQGAVPAPASSQDKPSMEISTEEQPQNTEEPWNPSIKLTKEGPATAQVGETIIYSFRLENDGNLLLFCGEVTDELLGGNILIAPIMWPGYVTTWDVHYKVKPGDCDPLVNTARATALGLCIYPGAESCSSVTTDILTPSIGIKKTGPEKAWVGQKVKYCITVTNTGETDLWDVKVTDDVLGEVGKVDYLPSGGTRTFEPEYTVKKTDPDPLKNTATVCAKSLCGEVSACAEHCMQVIHDPLVPAMSVEKSGPATAFVGDTIAYEIVVKNTGDGDLKDITVTDDVLGSIGTIVCLAEGAHQKFTAYYTVKASDPDPLVNTATAVASDPKLTAKGTHSTDLLQQGLTITKSGPESAEVGDQVTYEFEVANTGDVALENLTVTDNVLGEIGSAPTLNANDTARFTKEYTVQESDPDPLVNTATAIATGPLGPATDEDEHSLDILGVPVVPVGGIGVTKTCDDEDLQVQVGDLLSYTIVVANTGGTRLETVGLVDVFDSSRLSFESAEPPASAEGGMLSWEDVTGGAGLEEGATLTVRTTFLATGEGTVGNTVTATGIDDEGSELTASSSASAVITGAVVPSVPTPASVTPAADRTIGQVATLPVTGDNFYWWFVAGFGLVLMGLLVAGHGVVTGRRR